MPLSSRLRSLVRALLVVAAAVTMVATEADARAGRGGGGFGSRGGRTFDAPPATNTAPRTAAPIDRPGTAAQQPGVANPAGGVQRPGAAATGGFAGRGGFMGGMLGAGLIGAMLGYGLFGGLGGLASIIGLLLQVALVGFLVMLAIRFFRSRFQPAHAGATAAGASPLRRDATGGPQAGRYGAAAGGLSGVGAADASAARPAVAAAPRDDLGVSKPDYDAFERLLDTVQTAYGKGDVAALRAAATPEVAARFERDLAEDAARGVRNHVRDPKLLQGDLAEAWREGNLDYATVAMRFSLTDYTEELSSGRVVEGDPTRQTEATELWTFARPRGGKWQLSAVQQG
jgi:predicted lipid-binding transport protein (Tim44 family)